MKFAEIKFEELKSSIEGDQLVVIDVRSADGIKDTGKLPGSFNVPREWIRAHQARVGLIGEESVSPPIRSGSLSACATFQRFSPT